MVPTERPRALQSDREIAPLAVWQVRSCGGVLEHPSHSELWNALQLPRPGAFADAFGGWTLEVDQVSWGHAARKRTWLYIVGVPRSEVVPLRGGTPTHVVARRASSSSRLPRLHQRKRLLTPPLFAAWLVSIAAHANA
jgi:hypothetical protein